jgi:hypothetical protein
MREHRRLFWATAWLAVVFVAVKGLHLGAPAAATPRAVWDHVRDLAAVSFVDVLFAVLLWIGGTTALLLAGHRARASRAVCVVATAVAAVSCVYALATCSAAS